MTPEHRGAVVEHVARAIADHYGWPDWSAVPADVRTLWRAEAESLVDGPLAPVIEALAAAHHYGDIGFAGPLRPALDALDPVWLREP